MTGNVWFFIGGKGELSSSIHVVTYPDHVAIAIVLYVTGSVAGWYIYAESSGGSADDRAPLTTPRIGQTGPQCVLSFWYHMRGSHVGTLSVKLAFPDGTKPTIWSKTGNQGDKWQNSRLVIGSRQLFKVWVWQQILEIDGNFPNWDCQPPVCDISAMWKFFFL